jgi:hypothetical protein
MHTNIVNKYCSKSDKIQDFHMIVDDDPVVVDESINFTFNNEVMLVNNTSTLSTDTCIYINDLSNESEISNLIGDFKSRTGEDDDYVNVNFEHGDNSIDEFIVLVF